MILTGGFFFLEAGRRKSCVKVLGGWRLERSFPSNCYCIIEVFSVFLGFVSRANHVPEVIIFQSARVVASDEKFWT